MCDARTNPADEVTFKRLRLNMWVSSTTAWIPDLIFMKGNEEIDMDSLLGRDCYAGLDLSSTGDITALVLMFPPRNMDEKYILLPFFWVSEETIQQRVKAASVLYDIWERQGYLLSTEGHVIHYDFIEKFINNLADKYHIVEKDFYRLLMEGKIIHGGHPVLIWMAGNVVVDTEPQGSVYDERCWSFEVKRAARMTSGSSGNYFNSVIFIQFTSNPIIVIISAAGIVCSCFCNLLKVLRMDETNSFKSVLLNKRANMIAMA